MNQIAQQITATGFSIAPLTPTVGAVIEDIDLSRPLSPDELSGLRRALVDWKVLFFRDQRITTDQHLAFARRFGNLEVHPFAPHKPDYPEVLAITHDRESRGRENTWHSDVTWREKPSLGSVLRAVEVPPVGGDTLFSDMYAAYEGLSDTVKAKVDEAVAVHDFKPFRERMRRSGKSEEEIAAFDRQYPAVEHPVIRTHPESGRRAIYVNASFTQRIVGLEPDESAAMLTHLYAQAAVPEYQCRFRWETDSIAFWDNRACQHYAASDYWPAVRRMERVTIIGDRPV